MSSPTPDAPPETGRLTDRLPPALQRAWHLLHRQDLALLAVLVVVAGGAWGVVALGDAVTGDEVITVDERILLAFREAGDPNDPIGPHAVESAVRDVTALGSVTVIGFLTLATIGFFALSRRPYMATFVLFAIVGGVIVSYALKFTYDRTRPSIIPPEMLPGDPSFPSGHSAAAAVAYLTLGVLLARTLPQRRLKVYVVGLAALLAIAVGVSRVYLGVHWPTDVLAGWTIGAGWALLCWAAERSLQRRGLVERSVTVRRSRPTPAPSPPR